MPLYEGSCGCYNWEEAKEYGVIPAIVLNWVKNSYRHYKNKEALVDDMFWHDQTAVADDLALDVRVLYRAIETLEGAGVLRKRVGYRPGTTRKTTWWGFTDEYKSSGVSQSTKMALSIESTKMGVSILNNTDEQDSGEADDDDTPVNTIPLAAPTTSFVEVETFASDDNDKTIVVKREIPRKYWNNAVKIWRKDESKFARVEFKDEPGKVTSLRPSQIKSWNVRPQTQSLGYDRNAGTAFGVSHD